MCFWSRRHIVFLVKSGLLNSVGVQTPLSCYWGDIIDVDQSLYTGCLPKVCSSWKSYSEDDTLLSISKWRICSSLQEKGIELHNWTSFRNLLQDVKVWQRSHLRNRNSFPNVLNNKQIIKEIMLCQMICSMSRIDTCRHFFSEAPEQQRIKGRSKKNKQTTFCVLCNFSQLSQLLLHKELQRCFSTKAHDWMMGNDRSVFWHQLKTYFQRSKMPYLRVTHPLLSLPWVSVHQTPSTSWVFFTLYHPQRLAASHNRLEIADSKNVCMLWN